MADRTVQIKGPLTDEELREIVTLLQRIESSRPEEEFHIVINSEDTRLAVEEFLDSVPPLPDYVRTTGFYRRPYGS